MSITRLDSDFFISCFNTFRLLHGLPGIKKARFLDKICHSHVLKILKGDIKFGLGTEEDMDQRKRECSELFSHLKEFAARFTYGSSIFEQCIEEPELKKIFLNPILNSTGICIFECGNYVFIVGLIACAI